MEIAGVVLIGGKSKRMGSPKALLSYQGVLLYEKTAKLLEEYTDKVYISGTEKQKLHWNLEKWSFISDKYEGIGPLAGILSAFESLKKDQCAILVVATDMPHLNQELIELLIANRDPNKAATIFRNKETGFLEPLCAIYEYKSFDLMRAALKREQYALHRILDPDKIIHIDFNKNKALSNINYPEEFKNLH